LQLKKLENIKKKTRLESSAKDFIIMKRCSTVYSTAKAVRELGWRPQVTYAEGVQRAVEWFRTNTQ
jgi:nucleoside-diphosphate-sugar epimerase